MLTWNVTPAPPAETKQVQKRIIKMAQAETEKLTQMVFGAGLSRAISTIAELGVADQIEPGSPQPYISMMLISPN